MLPENSPLAERKAYANSLGIYEARLSASIPGSLVRLKRRSPKSIRAGRCFFLGLLAQQVGGGIDTRVTISVL